VVTFNHLGVTVPRSTIEEPTLGKLIGFFDDVFGWKPREGIMRPGHQIVMKAGGLDQFVVFFGHDKPTTANPPLDHFGMRVETLEELLAMNERAKDFAAKDPDLEWEDYSNKEFDDEAHYRLHKFYVRYHMPLQLEVQYYEWL
jgi:hypothetical protein